MLREPAHRRKDINKCELSVRFKPGTDVGIKEKQVVRSIALFFFPLFLRHSVPYTACFTVINYCTYVRVLALHMIFFTSSADDIILCRAKD